MDEDQSQIDALQKACEEDPVLMQVMSAFGRYKNAMSEISVDRIWKLSGGLGVMKRSRVVKALKRLEELGFGTYTKGTHGYKSRFAFAIGQGPLRLSMLARGVSDEDDLPDDEFEDNEVGNDLSLDGGLVGREFPLRDDLTLSVDLPGDLTFKEAKRLSLWLKSLPIDSEGEEY